MAFVDARGRTLAADLADGIAAVRSCRGRRLCAAGRRSEADRAAIPIGGRRRAGARAEGQGAIRILTGAPIPPDTSSVVMQEHVHVIDGAIRLSDRVRIGASFRRRGEVVALGNLAVSWGRCSTRSTFPS
ncbi:hypothetical protein [Acuticoccus sp.]|uniref:hypothetical protein n=1 Tax=Acuticoccus sp. TaxID=1904378 RepID=UPI003B5193E2